jgi:hypothetical protein
MVVLAWLCLKRRRNNRGKVHTVHGADTQYTEKQVVESTVLALPTKAELQGNGVANDGNLPQVVDYTRSPETYPRHAGAVELNSTPYQGQPQQYPNGSYALPFSSNELEGARDHNTVELQSSTGPSEMDVAPAFQQRSEIQGAGFHNTSELYSPTSRPDLYASAPPYASGPVDPFEYQSSMPTYQQHSLNEVQELHPKSPASSRSVVQRQLSSEEITALEEEERRIDAEMEEVRRMKDLRDQKLAVQQKLRQAKG